MEASGTNSIAPHQTHTPTHIYRMFLIFRNSFSSQLHSWDVKTNDYCLYTWLTHTQVSESWARRGGCQVPTGPHARQKYHTNQVNLNTSQRTSPFRSVRKHKWCWCWNTKYRKVVFSSWRNFVNKTHFVCQKHTFCGNATGVPVVAGTTHCYTMFVFS